MFLEIDLKGLFQSSIPVVVGADFNPALEIPGLNYSKFTYLFLTLWNRSFVNINKFPLVAVRICKTVLVHPAVIFCFGVD